MRNKRRGAIPRKTLEGRHITDNVDKFNRPLAPTITPFEAKLCTVQPYVGEDLIVGADGFQSKSAFTVFTDTPITEGEEGSLIKPDELLIYGKWYRAAKVKVWQVGVIPHYECTFVQKDLGAI